MSGSVSIAWGDVPVVMLMSADSKNNNTIDKN